MNTFENEQPVVSTLMANAPKDGIYVIPADWEGPKAKATQMQSNDRGS